MICSALGEGVVTHKTCKNWFQRFRNGYFDFSDRERPGQSKSRKRGIGTTPGGKSYSNGRKNFAHTLRVAQQAIYHHLYRLGRIQKAGRWPKTLN